MMKTIQVILLALLLPIIAFGQAATKLGIDCNPKLNAEEIQFFKNTFGSDTFDFQHKHIGFATNEGFRTRGFDNSTHTISKKAYFNLFRNDTKQKLRTKLLVLDSVQKQKANGFDAIIVAFDKKYEQQAATTNFNRTLKYFEFRKLNYPDNLDLVGNDTSAVLSTQDVSFLDQLFRHSRGAFSFAGKKIAIVNTGPKSIINKSVFINKVKKYLENNFLYPENYPYDFMYVFNDQQKKESGGYDAVIVYGCLKCWGGDAIPILRKYGS